MEWQRWVDPLTESNCYLLAEDRHCVVIDPNEPHGPLECMTRRGWTPELVLLTHEHCDHMAGLEALREAYPNIKTVASAACSRGLASKRLNMTLMMEVYLSYRGKPGVKYTPFVCRPAEITYETAWEYTWRGHHIRCITLPGHTPGSSGIFWDEEVFFSGDYLISGEDVILRLPGGDEEAYLANTKPVLDALPAGLWICPGHQAPYRKG